MTTKLLNGTKLKNELITTLQARITKLKTKGIVPHLVVVQVGEDHASNIYIKHKKHTSKIIGINFSWKKIPSDIPYETLKNEIKLLNNDNKVDAIIIQFPLPKHLNHKVIISLIDPLKDADGLHPLNQGIHFTGEKTYAPFPCTPKGIMTLLANSQINIEGKHVVVIGRSLIVGKPMSLLMIKADATVTTLHEKTKPEVFKNNIKNADIIVSATGKPDLFTTNDVKNGVVIIDVGMIRNADGKLRGDILYENFIGKASYVSPVPGGVGPMTVISLMETTIELTERKHNLK